MIKIVGCRPRESRDVGRSNPAQEPIRRRTVFNELAAMYPSVAESRCEYCGISGRCAVCGAEYGEPEMSEAGYQALWRALVEPGEWDGEPAVGGHKL